MTNNTRGEGILEIGQQCAITTMVETGFFCYNCISGWAGYSQIWTLLFFVV